MQDVFEKPVSAYRFGDVTVDASDFRVRKNGEPQKMTPKAFEVLIYLIENRGRVVEKRELFDQIWRENFVTDNALTRVVKEIRHTIGDDASAPRYIETVPKRGYRFIAEVEIVESEIVKPLSHLNEDKTEEKFDSETLADSSSSEKPLAHNAANKKNSNLKFIFVPLVLLGAVLLSVWFYKAAQNTKSFPAAGKTSQVTNWSGLDSFPAISPDGNSIAYSSDRNGGFEIFVKPLAQGAREIQVTADGAQNFQPAWSPDGQKIAFYSRKRGGIWLVPATGGSARQLTEFGSRPAWSPDGKTIAFQSGALTDFASNNRTLPPSALWLVSADGGEPRQLTEAGNPVGGHGAPAWSPDGKKIAFNAEDMASFGFWTIEIETRRLVQIARNAFDPVFAQDGKSIFYSTLNRILNVKISDATGEPESEPQQIIASEALPIRHPSLSADGKRIAYTLFRSPSHIWSVALDPQTGNSEAEAAPMFESTSVRNTSPSFSPDGSRIAFVSYIPGTSGVLYLMDADGKNPSQTDMSMTFPHWFPDCERIGSLTPPGEEIKFLSFNLTTGKRTELMNFDDAEYARLSPDGKFVAYNSKKSGAINLWLANLENREQKQMTFDNELMGFPAWSPDGKFIAFQIKRGDSTHIAVMPREGGTPELLTNEAGQSWVYSFSPDGDKIAFAGQRDQIWNVYWVSRSTKERKQLTNNAKPNAYVRYPAWSPRGDKIVFEYAETNGNVWLTELK
jgi:Tol biopolymer transport system component/DNA-binding winged helix-turn-helix (wHTH) protein